MRYRYRMISRARILSAIPGLVPGPNAAQLSLIVTRVPREDIDSIIQSARADAKLSGYIITEDALADEVIVRLAQRNDLEW